MKIITSLEPLGDQAALLYFPQEQHAAHFAAILRRTQEHWLVDVVQAYHSVAVFFDMDQTRFTLVADKLRELERSTDTFDPTTSEARLHRIPCCYEFQLDLDRVAQQAGLPAEEIIRLHSGTTYTVYAIGFCPGFPYLGYLPPKLQGVPRLDTPRLRVEPGSIGMTGKQTGIYTEARPGGWNIIARTPLELVNVRDAYFPLRTGDQVMFEPIDQTEFQRLLDTRLNS